MPKGIEMRDINYALIEKTRPPIYTSMKYWGKKPHNIWREYIKTYTPEGGAILDPFAGSAVAAFEAVKVGRKAVVYDINPLTSFLIEAYCAEFNLDDFTDQVNRIVDTINKDENYKKFFSTECVKCRGQSVRTMQHCKWDSGKIYEVGILGCQNKECSSEGRELCKPTDCDRRKAMLADKQKDLLDNLWVPSREFPQSPSFSKNFTDCLGGNRFANLWTTRNLYVLARIFNLIQKVKQESVKRHLLMGFIQSIHLCTKMCVPRREGANRGFSTSWGRSAYICAARQMEMNPLLLFHGNCLGRKQSVQAALSNFNNYIGKIPKILRVDGKKPSDATGPYDIKYGIIDAVTMDERFVTKQDKVKFIITDPPYGGLVQYMDLSSLWLVWLEKYDPRLAPNYDNEITIKRGVQELDAYQARMCAAIKKMANHLPDDGKIVFSFHNKDIAIWNAFLNAIFDADLVIEKVIHQPNRRTGESNVANPYGTSGNDFYIRCVKAPSNRIKLVSKIEEIVTEKAVEVIAKRNEPTPYQILLPGILAEISMSGFNLGSFHKDIEAILRSGLKETFVVQTSTNKKRGDVWWLAHPERDVPKVQESEQMEFDDLPLHDRVRLSVLGLLRKEVAVSLDEALAEIYVNYPNGLTPSKWSVESYLKQYAHKSQGKWVYNGDHQTGVSKHTEVLHQLSIIGKKMGRNIYIGKREQHEKLSSGKTLSQCAFNSPSLDSLGFSPYQLSRIEQIDMLWFNKDDSVSCALEVENTTNFLSGLHRASNLGATVPKIMVIPDIRLEEFKRAFKTELTAENFKNQEWQYVTYSAVTDFIEKGKFGAKEWNKALVSLDNDGL